MSWTAAPGVRVVIADSQPIFRDGLKCLLANRQEVRVVGTAATSREAVDMVVANGAEVLLLDLAISAHSGFSLLKDLARRKLACHSVIFMSHIDEPQSIEALRQGARGLVLKHVELPVLVKCLTAVAAGQFWVGRGAVGSIVTALRRVRPSRAGVSRFDLTSREADVVGAVATGATNRQIAATLKISEATAKQHLASALEKCGVNNRTELALFAIRHRLTN